MDIRVVIVEDNSSLRDGLCQLINGAPGFKCAGTLPNCENINSHINELKPDVILMDIVMPGMSGIEGVRLIKEYFPKVKILMETIFDDDEKIFQSICAGAEGYILKNTEPNAILSSIKEIYYGGSPMTPSIANRVLKLLRKQSSEPGLDQFDLTKREKEILSHLVTGMSYKMVAARCSISIDTVNAHVRHIYKKLQVNSKSEAVVKALKGKLI